MLYFTGDRAIVYAVDGRTGEINGSLILKLEKLSTNDSTWLEFNRGLAYLDGRLFLSATDGRLIAIDSTNGQEIWSVNTFEKLETDQSLLPLELLTILLLLDMEAQMLTRGYVTAYDAQTGEQKWRFYTVPGNPADGLKMKPWRWLLKLGTVNGGNMVVEELFGTP